MFSWDATNYYLRRMFGLQSSKSVEDVAVKTVELSPPLIRKNRPTIMLPGKLDRIVAYCSDTNRELELERLSGDDRKHDGTYAYLLKDAVIINGNLFCDGLYLPQLAERKHHIWFDLKREKAECALSCSLYGNVYWGHWLLDDCMKYFIAEQFGAPVVPERKPYGHQTDYERLLGMSLRSVNAVKFDSLWVFRDEGQNDSKRLRYQKLRERLLAAIGMENPPEHAGVYLIRGLAGSRRLMTNELEVAERLRQRGFRVIDPMKLTAEEILRACAGAKVVAGIDGSGLSHAIALMAPETTLLVINPPNRFNNVYKDMTDCMNVNYAVAVGISLGDDFYVDLDEIDQILNLIPT